MRSDGLPPSRFSQADFQSRPSDSKDSADSSSNDDALSPEDSAAKELAKEVPVPKRQAKSPNYKKLMPPKIDMDVTEANNMHAGVKLNPKIIAIFMGLDSEAELNLYNKRRTDFRQANLFRTQEVSQSPGVNELVQELGQKKADYINNLASFATKLERMDAPRFSKHAKTLMHIARHFDERSIAAKIFDSLPPDHFDSVSQEPPEEPKKD